MIRINIYYVAKPLQGPLTTKKDIVFVVEHEMNERIVVKIQCDDVKRRNE